MVDNKEIKAHRIILYSISPYFQTIFEGGFKEKNIIQLKEINSSTLETLLDLIYGNTVELTDWREVLELYNLMKYFMIPWKRNGHIVVNKYDRTEFYSRGGDDSMFF